MNNYPEMAIDDGFELDRRRRRKAACEEQALQAAKATLVPAAKRLTTAQRAAVEDRVRRLVRQNADPAIILAVLEEAASIDAA